MVQNCPGGYLPPDEQLFIPFLGLASGWQYASKKTHSYSKCITISNSSVYIVCNINADNYSV